MANIFFHFGDFFVCLYFIDVDIHFQCESNVVHNNMENPFKSLSTPFDE